MAFPQGIAFRDTVGFVTDGANDFCSPDIFSGLYPTTSTQGNTVGYEDIGTTNTRDRNSGIDVRIAGVHFQSSVLTATYRIDLPAAGDYKVRLAAGDYGSYGSPTDIILVDNATTLGTLASTATTAAQRWRDATDTEYDASTWPSSNALSAAYTFASTILRLSIGSVGAGSSIAYFYAESSGTAPITAVAVDTNTPTDSALADVSKVAVAVDTNTPTDSAVALTSRVAAGVDTNTPTDSALADVSKVAVAVDTNTPTDSAVASISSGAITAVAVDTNTPTDSALADVSKVAAGTDTNTPTDSAVALTSRVAVGVDTNTPTDSAIAERIDTITAAGVDTNTPTDSAVAVRVGPSSPSVGGGGWYDMGHNERRERRRKEELREDFLAVIDKFEARVEAITVGVSTAAPQINKITTVAAAPKQDIRVFEKTLDKAIVSIQKIAHEYEQKEITRIRQIEDEELLLLL